MARSDHDRWKSVAEAAAEVGAAPRSAYNWVRAGRLETRSENGKLLVDPAALAELAGKRAAKNGSASAGTSAGTGNGMATGTPRAPENDGELSAKVFAALKRGEALEDIIERMKLPAPVALALYDQFEKVRAAAKSGPSVLERLQVLEKQMAEVVALARNTARECGSTADYLSLTADTTDGLTHEVARMRPTVAQLTSTVRELVHAFRDEISCH